MTCVVNFIKWFRQAVTAATLLDPDAGNSEKMRRIERTETLFEPVFIVHRAALLTTASQ
jgi:hypothetical protein